MENTQKVLDMDPNRLVTAASGFTDFEIGHIQDYPFVSLSDYWNFGIRVCLLLIIHYQTHSGREYGGIEYNVPGHTWYPNPSGVPTARLPLWSSLPCGLPI